MPRKPQPQPAATGKRSRKPPAEQPPTVARACWVCRRTFAGPGDLLALYCSPRCEKEGERRGQSASVEEADGDETELKVGKEVSTAAVPIAKPCPTPARLLPHPATADVIYSDEDAEVLRAIEAYRRERKVRFPTWGEVIEIMRQLGWRKVK